MKILTTILVATCSTSAFAQQEATMTYFWNNYTYFNPAMSGLLYKHEAGVNYRNQWDKVNGAPNYIIGSYNAKLDKLHGGGGVSGKYMTIGSGWESKALLHYSFHIKTGDSSTLAVGASLGISAYEGLYNTANELTSNFGVVYRWKNLKAGISISNLTAHTYKQSGLAYTTARHYYLFADYIWNLSDNFALQPAVLLQTDAIKVSSMVTLRGIIKRQYWAGITYHHGASVGFMAGWDIHEKFRLGYCYELTTSKLSPISRGTHEVVLGLMLK